MSIQVMDDSQWPGRIRVTIRGSQDIWVTHQEAMTLALQMLHIINNPIPKQKPVKLFQLYDKRGRQ